LTKNVSWFPQKVLRSSTFDNNNKCLLSSKSAY